MYCDHFTIKTTDGTQSVLLAGVESTTGYTNGAGETAKFNKIASFVQLNSSHVVISDRVNHCFRLLNRTDNTVSDYAGKCNEIGYNPGKFLEARFSFPNHMIKGEGEFSHVIFTFTAHKNSAKYLDTRDEMVGIVTELGYLYPLTGVTTDTEDPKSLLFTHSSTYIRRVAIDTLPHNAEQTHVYQFSVGDYSDGGIGPYRGASLPNTRGIMGIARGVYLIPTNQSRIRVLDTHDEMISSICTGQPEYRSGSISECAIPGSYSISLVGRTLYIGGKTAIYKMLSKFIMETVYSVL